MAIHILCPHCHSPFVLGDELANQVFTCTHCAGLIQIPALPPAPLPPIEMIETYRQVVGDRPPLILHLLGIFTGWRWDSSAGDVLRFVWSLRHVALFVLIVIYTFKYTGSAEQATNAAPQFLGVTMVCILWGYLEAVWIARKQEGNGVSPTMWITTLIVDPLALVASDYEDALPAYRAWVLALSLAISCLCVAQRAGSLGVLLPVRVRRIFPAAAPASDPSPGSADDASAPPE
jgi:hypothetical protein